MLACEVSLSAPLGPGIQSTCWPKRIMGSAFSVSRGLPVSEFETRQPARTCPKGSKLFSDVRLDQPGLACIKEWTRARG